jgi:hypothetical protein
MTDVSSDTIHGALLSKSEDFHTENIYVIFLRAYFFCLFSEFHFNFFRILLHFVSFEPLHSRVYVMICNYVSCHVVETFGSMLKVV